jgi:DNA-binding NarL/FixJ family response regulator
MLLLTAEAGDADLFEALQLGAHGIVLKHSTPDLLFKSIRTVMAGQYWLGRECVADLIGKMRQAPDPLCLPSQGPNFGLTARELDIVGAVVAGCSNADVAKQLSISAKTVKHHLTNIFDKLGVSNRVELALFAVQHHFSEGRFE